jgi:hypothetical protein
MRRSSARTRGTSSNTSDTITMRCHTSCSAPRVINLPRMPVKPQHKTQTCICSQARIWAESEDIAGEAYPTWRASARETV